MESAKLWDIFCRVVDNYGDIGVCWRLAADLAARGNQVRLWVDDARALDWMAPGALQGRWPGVRVLPWDTSRQTAVLASLPPADVWIEGFGCEIAPEFLRWRFGDAAAPGTPRAPAPVWLNLEYLSAEAYVERVHGLPSPLLHGPAAGHTRFFFYPGMTDRTGGLLREPGLAALQAGFDRRHWLAAQGIPWQGERLVSLFCYEPGALAQLLEQLRRGPEPTQLLVTHGRAAAAVRGLLARQAPAGGAPDTPDTLQISFLPPLSQPAYDRLLWACDLNFVRGEDSLVRAIWAGKPWIWQIYPQEDGAHHAKLNALLATLEGPGSWHTFHQVWNASLAAPLPALELASWGVACARARAALERQNDLCSRLLEFVARVPAAHQVQAEKS